MSTVNDRAGRKWAEFSASFWSSFDRFNPVCALCGVQVDVALRGRSPWSRSIDHLVPIKLGGRAYDRANCQPVHLACNGARQTRAMTEFATAEQRAAFRKVVEAQVVVQQAKREHQATNRVLTEPAPGTKRHFVPWGWGNNEGTTPAGERYWTCCLEPATNIDFVHECKSDQEAL